VEYPRKIYRVGREIEMSTAFHGEELTHQVDRLFEAIAILAVRVSMDTDPPTKEELFRVLRDRGYADVWSRAFDRAWGQYIQVKPTVPATFGPGVDAHFLVTSVAAKHLGLNRD
jgi:hypothetical protein